MGAYDRRAEPPARVRCDSIVMILQMTLHRPLLQYKTT